MADDGMGGTIADQDDPIAAQFADVGEDPDDGFEPAAPEPSAPADPFEGFPDEVRRAAEAKGWKSPEDLGRAYTELEKRQGADGGKVGELEQQLHETREALARMEGAMRSQLEPAAGGDDPLSGITSVDDAIRMVDWDSIDAQAQGDPAIANRIFMGQVLPELLKINRREVLAEVGQEVGPVRQAVSNDAIRRQATELVGRYGDNFRSVSNEVGKRLQQDSTLRQHPKGMELAYLQIAAEKGMALTPASRGEGEGLSLLGGAGPDGGRTQEVDVAAQIRDAVRGAGPGAGVASGRDGL